MRRGEPHARDALQHERVRRHFHRARLAAALDHLAQQPLHFRRLRRRVRRVALVGGDRARRERVTVPRRPHGSPAASNTDASRYVVVVLPFVPVTPTTVELLARMAVDDARPVRRAPAARRSCEATGTVDAGGRAASRRRSRRRRARRPRRRTSRRRRAARESATKTVPARHGARVVRDARHAASGAAGARSRARARRARASRAAATSAPSVIDRSPPATRASGSVRRSSSTLTSPGLDRARPASGVCDDDDPYPRSRTDSPTAPSDAHGLARGQAAHVGHDARPPTGGHHRNDASAAPAAARQRSSTRR